MGEILPNGEMLSLYGARCKKCGVEIRVNMQGQSVHMCDAPQEAVEGGEKQQPTNASRRFAKF